MITMRPRPSSASRALSTRLRTTCSISAGAPLSSGTSDPRSKTSSIVGAGDLSQERLHRVQDRVQLIRDQGPRPGAHRGEEALRHPPGPLDRLNGACKLVAGGGRVALLQRLRGRVDVVADHEEKVVHVMGKPAREAPEALELGLGGGLLACPGHACAERVGGWVARFALLRYAARAPAVSPRSSRYSP